MQRASEMTIQVNNQPVNQLRWCCFFVMPNLRHETAVLSIESLWANCYEFLVCFGSIRLRMSSTSWYISAGIGGGGDPLKTIVVDCFFPSYDYCGDWLSMSEACNRTSNGSAQVAKQQRRWYSKESINSSGKPMRLHELKEIKVKSRQLVEPMNGRKLFD